MQNCNEVCCIVFLGKSYGWRRKWNINRYIRDFKCQLKSPWPSRITVRYKRWDLSKEWYHIANWERDCQEECFNWEKARDHWSVQQEDWSNTTKRRGMICCHFLLKILFESRRISSSDGHLDMHWEGRMYYREENNFLSKIHKYFDMLCLAPPHSPP